MPVSVAVTLTTTSVASAGTPAAATSTRSLAPPATPAERCLVSSTRNAPSGRVTKRPASTAAVTGTYAPETSTATSIWRCMYTSTAPPAPSLTVTMLASTWPTPSKLTFDAVGRSVPAGYTVTKPAAVVLTPVTFNTAALALAGTPSRPATCTRTTLPEICVKPNAP